LLVAKTMVQQKKCKGCIHENDCRAVYRKLTSLSAAADSFAFKACFVFLLPILVFITSLAAFERIVTEAVNTKHLQTTLSFLLAVSITFTVVLIIKVINRQFNKNK